MLMPRQQLLLTAYNLKCHSTSLVCAADLASYSRSLYPLSGSRIFLLKAVLSFHLVIVIVPLPLVLPLTRECHGYFPLAALPLTPLSLLLAALTLVPRHSLLCPTLCVTGWMALVVFLALLVLVLTVLYTGGTAFEYVGSFLYITHLFFFCYCWQPFVCT